MNVCSKCGNTHVIIKNKSSGQILCKDCFLKTTKSKVLHDIRKYKLVEKGDKVLLGLSGGKDSVMLLEILNSLKERHIIDLVAVTIDEGISGYREDGVRIAKLNTKKMGVKHRIVSFKEYFGFTLDDVMKKTSGQPHSRHPCTYCGVFRRWFLNRVAKEEGATKIATGHNLNDETESILMNYLEGNIQNLTRIGPKSESRNERFTVKIKPLREIPEREIGLYVVAKGLEVHFAGCPYAGESFRAEVGRCINDLTVKHPNIMYSTLRGFEKMKPVLKKEFAGKSSAGICENCGEPASGRLCKACSFVERWDENNV